MQQSSSIRLHKRCKQVHCNSHSAESWISRLYHDRARGHPHASPSTNIPSMRDDHRGRRSMLICADNVVLAVNVPDADMFHLEVDPQDCPGSIRWVGDLFDPRLRSCLAAVCYCSSPVPEVADKKVALPLGSGAGSLRASWVVGSFVLVWSYRWRRCYLSAKSAPAPVCKAWSVSSNTGMRGSQTLFHIT
jgi:hypothetical protein